MIREQVRADGLDGWTALRDGQRVLIGDRLALELLRRCGVCSRWDILKTIAVLVPKLRMTSGDRAVEAGENGADADDGAGADDDAEHGEERAHLVLAHGGEREADGGAEFTRVMVSAPLARLSNGGNQSSFHPQRFNRVQLARRARRIDSEEQADRGGQSHADQHGGKRHRHRHGGEVAHNDGDQSTRCTTPIKPPMPDSMEDSTRN